MARLNENVENDDDDLPDLHTILNPPREAAENRPKAFMKQDGCRSSPTTLSQTNATEASPLGLVNYIKETCNGKKSHKQRPLRQLEPKPFNSLLSNLSDKSGVVRGESNTGDSSVRSSPRRKNTAPIGYSIFAASLSENSLSLSENNDSFTDASGSIVPDSASNENILPSWSQKRNDVQKPLIEPRRGPSKKHASNVLVSPVEVEEDTGPINLGLPKKEKRSTMAVCPESSPRFRNLHRLSDPAEAYTDLDEPLSRLRLWVMSSTRIDLD